MLYILLAYFGWEYFLFQKAGILNVSVRDNSLANEFKMGLLNNILIRVNRINFAFRRTEGHALHRLIVLFK